MCDIKEFSVDIAREEVERLRSKVKDFRLSSCPESRDADRNYGDEYSTAAYLQSRWINDFDWYEAQSEMNEVPQYLATIEDLTIHFVHVRSQNQEAIPLLAIHGWPGTFWEYSRVWRPLSDRNNLNDPSFHVVVPSMPGFCWSSSPKQGHWKLQDNARVFDTLMKSLGYNEYMVQCGDWVHAVGRELGAKYTNSCKLLHCNYAPIPLPDDIQLTEGEKKAFRKCEDWAQRHGGFDVTGRTKPHTIGLALQDNPMGILMWVLEKHQVVGHSEPWDNSLWTKAILTTASLYFFTGCIMSSIMPYYDPPTYEKFSDLPTDEDNRIKVPFGFTSFSWDADEASKRAVKQSVEQNGNLVFYRGLIHRDSSGNVVPDVQLTETAERNDSGHLAALQQPDELVRDIRDLAKEVWGKQPKAESPSTSGGLKLSFNPIDSRVRHEYRT
ncbi:epoxide hydrolase [Colletotrichum nymphaeae SA-01]|uniref:Epoxide hydrolase n=1 Tax=Colletotrichum nymphaeae SA-01 TaxID=1460502 RepID=A0A135SNI0_9PEZI|nr:epoxide hydrolase [Colletotrichum nymphaeae SA-01]